jgi:integrase/recombinase XerD
LRRTAGFTLHTAEKLLRHFVSFATQRGDVRIRTTTAVAWATLASAETHRAKRLRLVEHFARFARVEDPTHELPPAHLFRGGTRRRRPYLFSDEEIQRLLLCASRLRPAGALRPLTYQTLLGLLIATGMRISEVLALRCTDFTPEGIVISRTKFRKSRLVPLHPTTHAALEQYLRHRQRLVTTDDHLFVSRRGQPYRYATVAQAFIQLLAAAGIHGHPNSPRPRLHDFRHRFAVKALEACPDSRDHVARHMLALSTYLGHARLESTYWYLETTPQLMLDIVMACETFRQGGPL